MEKCGRIFNRHKWVYYSDLHRICKRCGLAEERSENMEFLGTTVPFADPIYDYVWRRFEGTPREFLETAKARTDMTRRKREERDAKRRAAQKKENEQDKMFRCAFSTGR